MQTCTQVLQRSSKRPEFHLLVARSGLPEALKGVCDIVLFALQAICHCSSGMIANPIMNHPPEAVLYPGPCFLIALYDCSVKEFQTIPPCVRFTPAIIINFSQTLCYENGKTQLTALQV
jgi:hypothetical protein